MPTATYVPIQTYSISNSTTASVEFGAISTSAYTDLIIKAVGFCDTANLSQVIRFNNDSSALYSLTYVGGNNSTTVTNRTSNSTGLSANYLTGWSGSSTSPANWSCHIMNHANTSIFKNIISRAGLVAGGVYIGTETVVGLYRSTSAITSITVSAGYTASHFFGSGTKITLYGIKAA